MKKVLKRCIGHPGTGADLRNLFLHCFLRRGMMASNAHIQVIWHLTCAHDRESIMVGGGQNLRDDLARGLLGRKKALIPGGALLLPPRPPRRLLLGQEHLHAQHKLVHVIRALLHLLLRLPQRLPAVRQGLGAFSEGREPFAVLLP